MRTQSIIAAVLALFGGSLAANAELIDVSFYGTNFGYTAPSGAAILGQAGDQWNSVGVGNPNIPTAFGPYSLSDTTGAATGATLNFIADGGVVSVATGTQPDPNLTNTYIYNNTGGSITADLSGLVPNQSYELVLYVASDDAMGGARALTGTANGTAFSATGDAQATFVSGKNFVELSATADASGDLSIIENNLGNSSGEVDLNGFQLQSASTSVPEPASFVLLLGLICAALLLQRKVQHARR